MSKQNVDCSKLEKLAEDLWERMQQSTQFDVLCDPDINLEWADDRATFIRMLVNEAKETFQVRND